MIYFESGNLNICLGAANNITACLSGGNIQVVIGAGAQISLKQAINYIKSGKAELQPLVTEAAVSANSASDAAGRAQNILTEIEEDLSDYVKKSDAIFFEEI